MKLIKLKCPNCNADIQANEELEKATCNYCGASFAIEDENITKEERILKTKSRIEEKAKEADRKYYASDEYKKKIDIEKETTIERIFRKANENLEKQRAYENSPEGKRETKKALITAFCCIGGLFLFVIIILVLFPVTEEKISCEIDDQRYFVVIKKDEEIKCASCSEEMLNELNEKYLDKTDIYTTSQNVQDYFNNHGGACDTE